MGFFSFSMSRCSVFLLQNIRQGQGLRARWRERWSRFPRGCIVMDREIVQIAPKPKSSFAPSIRQVLSAIRAGNARNETPAKLRRVASALRVRGSRQKSGPWSIRTSASDYVVCSLYFHWAILRRAVSGFALTIRLLQ